MRIKKEILDLFNSTTAFLEHTGVKVVYKFDEKSTANDCKDESAAKMPFNFWGVTYIHIYVYIHMDTNTDHIGNPYLRNAE